MGFTSALCHLTPYSEMKTRSSSLIYGNKKPKRTTSTSPMARLFGPSIFEASKLKVLFVGIHEKKNKTTTLLPRTYTLTHSDVTSHLTLAISHTIHHPQLQGWYHWLQRDEVVAEWKKVRGEMSLHVHCHISGGHFLLNLFASFRHYIFSKELPVVLKAFVHGDESLFSTYPELEHALVWIHFHSNIPEFDRVECWGTLREAATAGRVEPNHNLSSESYSFSVWKRWCDGECCCCFPRSQSIIDMQLLNGIHEQP
ncbi:Staygreen protein [Dioscorea alata]|uniref:Staygreen protein n=1 Tax=Dioscorea alata TaxID=55571 RepID=A0ACB7WW21_DIOAL|nr:Staygreen protein [Dioscorea alata]